MRYRDVSVTSVGGLLTALKRQSRDGKTVWFRGHAVMGWQLVPSLARKTRHLIAEAALRKRFMQNAVPHLARTPSHEWEWMFMMQHHRVPTRLLDWTESPLAALYFTVSDARHLRSDGAVWCLDPVALNAAAHISNFQFAAEIPSFDIDAVLGSYLPSHVDEPSSAIMRPVAIMGPRNTPRMAAQLGVFTINHRAHIPIEILDAGKHAWRWVVPAAAKKGLRKELALLGFTALTLFPELDRVADVAKELLQ